MMMDLCPCCSGLDYVSCCKKFHDGVAAGSALELMRSRYAAYALGFIDYIIQTTHPKKRSMCVREGIEAFSKKTRFERLEILDAEHHGSHATVTFQAHLLQQGRDASFTEKSVFEKIKGRWFYLEGQASDV